MPRRSRIKPHSGLFSFDLRYCEAFISAVARQPWPCRALTRASHCIGDVGDVGCEPLQLVGELDEHRAAVADVVDGTKRTNPKPTCNPSHACTQHRRTWLRSASVFSEMTFPAFSNAARIAAMRSLWPRCEHAIARRILWVSRRLSQHLSGPPRTGCDVVWSCVVLVIVAI